jgi:hypothetical protein
LLGELHGQLRRMLYAMYHWRKELEDFRWGMVSRWVQDQSSGTYYWRREGGIELIPERGPTWSVSRVDEPWQTDRFAELERLCEELATLMARISDAGLHSVALRLAGRVFWPLHHLGLTMPLPTVDSIRRQFGTPSWLGDGWKPTYAIERAGDGELLPGFEADLEDEAFKRARWADLALGQVTLAQRSVDDVLGFLGRRVAGTFWTRAAGIVKS